MPGVQRDFPPAPPELEEPEEEPVAKGWKGGDESVPGARVYPEEDGDESVPGARVYPKEDGDESVPGARVYPEEEAQAEEEERPTEPAMTEQRPTELDEEPAPERPEPRTREHDGAPGLGNSGRAPGGGLCSAIWG